MNGARRQYLRHAIDQKVRADRERFLAAVGRKVCVGCQCDLDQTTVGCKHCHDRKRRRWRRDAEA